MQLTQYTLATIALLTSYASAQTAFVINSCAFPVYISSAPNNGAAAAATVTIPPGGTFSEPYTSFGSAIRIANSSSIASPLTFEYTPNRASNLVYYDLSNNAGNPFSGFENVLVPSNSSCYRFDCKAGDTGTGCYSNGASIKVQACTPTDLTTRLCTAFEKKREVGFEA
ncbi:MAG: hypothetical protein M1820_009745 [Bogoriella megaspora]|nr:MAG: hypothetical protein M1820_009745 [Bogoriella megaspora]